jgi:hypothetical protein
MIPKWAESALDKPAKYSAEEMAAAREPLQATPLSALEKANQDARSILGKMNISNETINIITPKKCETPPHKKRGRPRKG